MDDHAEAQENGSERGAYERAASDAGRARDDLEERDFTEAADAQGPADAQGAADAINAVRGLVEQVLEEGLNRVKGEGGRLGSRASQTVSSMLTEFGVAQRRDHEDLELRIAQLEHRVRLLEGDQDAGGEAGSTTGSAAARGSGAARASDAADASADGS